MARIRRTYTPEFKAEAVKLVTEQGYSVAEAARSLGLCDNLLRSWKQAAWRPKVSKAFPAARESSPHLRGRRTAGSARREQDGSWRSVTS